MPRARRRHGKAISRPAKGQSVVPSEAYLATQRKFVEERLWERSTLLHSWEDGEQERNGVHRCRATSKSSGRQCTHPAMKGTVEAGTPRCHSHGGRKIEARHFKETGQAHRIRPLPARHQRNLELKRARWAHVNAERAAKKKAERAARKQAKEQAAELGVPVEAVLPPLRRPPPPELTVAELYDAAVAWIDRRDPHEWARMAREGLVTAETPMEHRQVFVVERACRLGWRDLEALGQKVAEAVEFAHGWLHEELMAQADDRAARRQAEREAVTDNVRHRGEGVRIGGVPYAPPKWRGWGDGSAGW